MSDNIPPFEIQMEIIKKARDVKTLIRFKSVSKPWKAFIDSSEFLTSYGVRHTQPHRLLLRYRTSGVEKYLSFIDDICFPKQQLDFAPNVPDLVKQLRCFNVIGSSCGLWCLYGEHGFGTLRTEMVVIWNPSIRKSIGIVVPCEFDNNVAGKVTLFGFGVCPSTYDPTIVGISRCSQGKCKRDHRITWQVGIFTLSSKTWKMIPSSNTLRGSVRVLWSTRVAIDRFIFWAANDDASRCKSLIVSFDLITHEFKEVNLPDSIPNGFFSISKLRESIVVSATEVNERVYGVWMMEAEGGAMTSFTKLFTINTPDSLVVRRILGYKKSGEPIIETEKDDEGFTKLQVFTKIQVYDPCSEHINDDFGITGVDGSFFICPYAETLLLSNHSDGCIIPNN